MVRQQISISNLYLPETQIYKTVGGRPLDMNGKAGGSTTTILHTADQGLTEAEEATDD